MWCNAGSMTFNVIKCYMLSNVGLLTLDVLNVIKCWFANITYAYCNEMWLHVGSIRFNLIKMLSNVGLLTLDVLNVIKCHQMLVG